MKRKLLILGLVLGMVGALLATSGAYGIHDEDSSGDNVLRLHLNGPGDSYFEHDELPPQILTDPGNCEVDYVPTLVSLVGQKGSSSPKPVGLSQNSIGVKSKGPGISCGRVDYGEFLTLSIANDPDPEEPDLLDGLNFIGGELDIETKKNVTVVAELYLGGMDPENLIDTFYLRTGSSIVPDEGVPPSGPYSRKATSTYDDPDTAVDERVANCGSQSDSGPDSGANDNCRWTIESLLPFDTIVFSPLDPKTEFGLEGGGDFGGSGGASDTLLFLTDIGVLDCGQSVTEGDPDGENITVLRGGQVGCVLKPYSINFVPADEFGVSFVPSGPADSDPNTDTPAEFTATIVWPAETAVLPVPVTRIDFDGPGVGEDPEPVQWCTGTAGRNPDGTLATHPEDDLDAYVDFAFVDPPELPTDGAPWCLLDQDVTYVNGGNMQVTEYYYGKGVDPFMDR